MQAAAKKMEQPTNNFSDIIPVEAIRERDADLLILEELKCNNDFRRWFLEKTIEIEDFNFIGAWHSLHQAELGESDLTFEINHSNKRMIFLLENKIDAVFQPNQAERYRQRGEKLKNEGQCKEFYTVLLAPQKYMGLNNDFDFYISYESIKNWYLDESKLGERAKYKAGILSIAIEKLRRGYTPIIDEATTGFWWTYYRYANENYPHLKMRKPQVGVPSGSNFIRFEPINKGLIQKISIIHKGNGSVDLELSWTGEQLQEFIKTYSDKLTEEMEVTEFEKSSAIRISVDKFDTANSFESQLENIKYALQKADLLYNWAKENLKITK